MARLKYVKVVGGQVVKRVTVEQGKEPDRGDVALDNGPRGDGGPVWRPIVTVDVDNSTGADVITEVSVVLSPKQETRTRTTRDKTQAEIDADDTAARDAVVSIFDTPYDPVAGLAKMVKELRGETYALRNEIETIKVGAPTTISKGAQNSNFINGGKVWNDTQFKDKWKDALNGA